MLIRVATADDLPRVVELDSPARQPDGTRTRFLTRHLDDGHVLVAEHDDQIAGYTVQDCSFFERGFIHLLYVADEQRRRGVGAALLDAAVVACGTRRVFTSTNSSNTRMQGLLAKLGWVRTGMVDGLDEGDPEVFYYVDAM